MGYRYTLVRSRRRKKTMSIMVNREGQVVVRAPYGVSFPEIETFVCRKSVWLSRKIAQWEAGTAQPGIRSPILEKEVLYLGDAYPLNIDHHNTDAKDALHWSGRAFHVRCRQASAGEALLAHWYIRRAEELFPERLAHHATIMGVSPKGIRISSARFRYGSCSARQRISLSWRLIMAPREVIDAVIIHELSHLTEMNHSPRFWSRVRTFCPDYERHKLWLKANCQRLSAI